MSKFLFFTLGLVVGMWSTVFFFPTSTPEPIQAEKIAVAKPELVPNTNTLAKNPGRGTWAPKLPGTSFFQAQLADQKKSQTKVQQHQRTSN